MGMRASQSAKDQQKFLLRLSEEECPKHHSDLHYHSKIIAIIRVLNEKQLVCVKIQLYKSKNTLTDNHDIQDNNFWKDRK